MTTKPSSAAVPETGSRRFVLEMLGFQEAEKATLISTFRLTSRRPLFYAEPATPDERPDIYLVNADNPDALRHLGVRSPNPYAPAVLVGHPAPGMLWPLIETPIRWVALFEQLDRSVLLALEERKHRVDGGTEKWDGRTYRRAADRKPLEAEYLAAHPIESVLVVDDSATVRAFMRAKLEPFRFDVDFAENGEIAVEMAQVKTYTCIFLDVMMPGIDGYEVCKQIKGNGGARSTAVVMLSSKSSEFDKFRGTWAGCDAYLGKPVAEDELLITLARFLPSARKVVAPPPAH